MTTSKTLKTIVFSIVLATLSLSTTNLHAQNDIEERGLLGRGESSNFKSPDYNQGMWNRGISGIIWTWTLSNENYGDSAPLGSGIAILIGAGLGYVALKKKEDEQ